MKTKLTLITLLFTVIFTGCTSFVGNSPMERKHREGLPSTPDSMVISTNLFAIK